MAVEFHYGVREHGMGGAVNGMTLSHLRGYGSTSWCSRLHCARRSASRRSWNWPATWVFTHDSIASARTADPSDRASRHATRHSGLDTIAVRCQEVAAAWKAIVSENDHRPRSSSRAQALRRRP